MLTDCDEAVARLSFGELSFTYGEDNKVVIDEDEWKQLCAAAAGDSKGITVEVYGKKDDKMTALICDARWGTSIVILCFMDANDTCRHLRVVYKVCIIGHMKLYF